MFLLQVPDNIVLNGSLGRGFVLSWDMYPTDSEKCFLQTEVLIIGNDISQEMDDTSLESVWIGDYITFEKIASKLQDELIESIADNRQLNDYELIVYKYVFSSELGVPIVDDLNFEIKENSFFINVIPDDLELDLLRKLDDVFDKFKVTFAPNPYNVIKLKFSYVGDKMYDEEEKRKLMEDLAEMETFKADVGDEGKILQEDLKEYFINGNGDRQDLIFRLELYFYAFKLFCRKEVRIDRNQFTIFLNDSILEWNLIKLVMQDFTDFEFEIEAVKENNDVLLNLNYTLHY